MHRCVPMLVKEGKKQEQAVAQCLGMFKNHWKSKGVALSDESSAEFQEMLANFNWDECEECKEMENDINKSHGIFEIDMSQAKISVQCDGCKAMVDMKPKKPEKGKDGKAKSVHRNPAIKATLETKVDSDETSDYHFCSERCLYNFLKARYK